MVEYVPFTISLFQQQKGIMTLNCETASNKKCRIMLLALVQGPKIQGCATNSH